MHMRSLGSLAGLFSTMMILAGCGTTQVRQPGAEQRRFEGRQQVGMVAGKQFSLLHEPEMATLLSQVGDRVRRAAGATENAFLFQVVKHPTLNSAIAPNGQIFLYSGLLLRLNNDTELAGVLAHEMAHRQAGHLEHILRSQALNNAPGRKTGLDPGSLESIAGTLALAEEVQAHYSPGMEEEADTLAMQYLQKAGYDPQGLLGMLLVIGRYSPITMPGAPTDLNNHRQVKVRSDRVERLLKVSQGGSYRPVGSATWNRARAFFHAWAGKPEESLLEYTARSASGLPIDRALLAVVLLETRDYQQAEEDLRIAINGDKENALFHSDLGRALFHLERIDESRKILEHSLSLPGGADYSRTHYYLAKIQQKQGDAAAALASLRKAVQCQPQLPEAYNELGALAE
jgi:predicted Zn-dependent protease